ncbi:uncharacterized protein BT62DRAFT_466525 [Guyanagaster necrorhizus]|uniref:Uncharacterized protein n=1 Tax=Guyanagaster necrorhizus TaxID=856835 RepID=A0A9P7VJI5_9AGAR|nr:uncharacterized protein BT62DRAFT_466525 [Guyanagaster necrorhizus MCA 3950]KAG7441849.1 hypothetical protein BT62DRAFT_466525 [Guyanagaster necrorhizus MCA 3950]
MFFFFFIASSTSHRSDLASVIISLQPACGFCRNAAEPIGSGGSDAVSGGGAFRRALPNPFLPPPTQASIILSGCALDQMPTLWTCCTKRAKQTF